MIGSRLWWRVALAAVVLAVTGPAWAADRLALVMGNSAYNAGSGWRPLPQAVNDARAVAERLRKAGFQVIDGYNLTRQGMNDKLTALVQAIASAPELVMVYYSGHGADFLGGNYLIPVDAVPVQDKLTANQLEDRYFPVFGKIIANLGGDKNRSNLVVLDSCRNDPLVKGFSSRGNKGVDSIHPFSDMGKPSGTLIVYAAKPGSYSLEGPEGAQHSIFTGALLEVWDKHPGINVATLFAEAGQLTMRRAPQEPVYDGSSAAGLIVLTSPAIPPPDTRDEQAWSQAAAKDSVDALKQYVATFPNGRHVSEAKALLKAPEHQRESKMEADKNTAHEEQPKQPAAVPTAMTMDTKTAYDKVDKNKIYDAERDWNDPDIFEARKSWGLGVRRDDWNPERALEYYSKAAARGNPAGYYGMGMMYLRQFYDKEKAVKYFGAAAERGYVKANVYLGQIFSDTGKKEEALSKFHIAAAKGDGEAMQFLGREYMKLKNIVEAKKWYIFAYASGISEAKSEYEEEFRVEACFVQSWDALDDGVAVDYDHSVRLPLGQKLLRLGDFLRQDNTSIIQVISTDDISAVKADNISKILMEYGVPSKQLSVKLDTGYATSRADCSQRVIVTLSGMGFSK